MDIEHLDRCMQPALDYWNLSQKAKNWPTYRQAYFEELGGFPPVALEQAIKRCRSTYEFFPSVSEIIREISRHTDVKVRTARDESILIDAERALDGMFDPDSYKNKKSLSEEVRAAIKRAYEDGELVSKSTDRVGEPVEHQDAARLILKTLLLELT